MSIATMAANNQGILRILDLVVPMVPLLIVLSPGCVGVLGNVKHTP
jgi:hypothetical protein